MSYISDFVNLFFPEQCVSCTKRLSPNEKHICISCLEAIPRTRYHQQVNNRLEEFFAGRFPFVRIAAFAHFVKDGIIQSIVHELKYRNNPEIGVYIGQISGIELKGSEFISDIDFIVPVPLHSKRERERGYNQSEKIALGISDITSVAISDKNLIRTKNTVSQTKHSRFERWANTEDAFFINNPQQFKEKHILLIDDILTTGSTLESCAKTILSACCSCKLGIYTIGAVN